MAYASSHKIIELVSPKIKQAAYNQKAREASMDRSRKNLFMLRKLGIGIKVCSTSYKRESQTIPIVKTIA